MVLACAFLLASGARAEAEKPDAHSVRLCNISFSVKIKAQGRQLKALNSGYSELWQKTRTQDTSAACRRLYEPNDKARLAKLVSIGKTEKATHIVAPTAGKKGAGIEISFWLVDVNKGQVVGDYSKALPLRAKQLKNALPAAWTEAVEKLLPMLPSTGETNESVSPADATADSTSPTQDTTEATGNTTATAHTDGNDTAQENSVATGTLLDGSSESAPQGQAPASALAQGNSTTEGTQPEASEAASLASATSNPPESLEDGSPIEATSDTSDEGMGVSEPDEQPTAAAVRGDETAIKASSHLGALYLVPLIGAAGGGLVGGALGGLTGWLAVPERNRSEMGNPDLAHMIWVGALIGAGTGAITGGLLSSSGTSGAEAAATLE